MELCRPVPSESSVRYTLEHPPRRQRLIHRSPVPLSRIAVSLDDRPSARHHQQVPPSSSEAASPAARWLVPLLLLAPSAIFVLPYFVPVAPAFAESYLFGFNNRAALLLVLALVTLLGVLSWRGVIRLPQLPDLLPPHSAPGSSRSPGRPALAASLAATTILSITFFALLRAGHGAGDAIYFLDRIGLVAQGLRPFHDFEFVYGPLQLYLPWLVARLLHCSLFDGYGLVWGLSTLLGLVALWLSIRWLDLPSPGKRSTFLILAAILGSELLSFGLNYNPLRYTAPIACLLFVERLSRSDRPSFATDRSTILAAAAAAIILLGLSPEVGVAFCIAILCFLPARRLALRQPWATFAFALAAAFALIFLAAAHLGIFETMRSFSAGAFNLPLLPGPHILLFLSALAVITIWLTARSHRSRLVSPVALLALYSLGMLPGALGRCDWAHVLGYELGIVLVALLLLAASPWSRRLSQAALVLIFLAMFLRGVPGTLAMVVKVQLYPALAHGDPTSGFGQHLLALTRRSLLRSVGPAETAHKLTRIRAVARLTSEDPHLLFPAASPILYAPFSYSPERLGNVQSPSLVEGHFMGALNLLTPAQVAQKIAEMQDHPEQDLLLSPDGLEQCAPFRGDPATLRSLFLLPFVPKPRNQYALVAPVCQYIQAHYRLLVPPSPQTGDYGLWRRQPATP